LASLIIHLGSRIHPLRDSLQLRGADMSGPLYLFSNRVISSSVPLPTLAVTPDEATPDFRVVSCSMRSELREDVLWIHSWLDEDGAISMSLAREMDEEGAEYFRFRIFEICDFLIFLATGDLEIEAHADVDNETIEHLLIDQVLPRLLAHQGNLVVHASVVELSTGVALFVGKSGWGKSTLASILDQAGHSVLSDDCAVLQMDETGSVVAIPTYPSLRLFDDSIEGVFRETPATIRVASYSDKQRVRLGRQRDDTKKADVLSIYVLDDPNLGQVSAISIQPVPTARACMALVENSFRLDVSSRQQSAAIFRQAAAISRTIPAYSLQYPRNYSNNATLAQALAYHFGDHSEEPA
jgi:hypothetical protein